MKDYTMDQYTIQSYFKSLCNSFYIAYEQIKRLEEKKKEIEDAFPQEELETVNMLLENYSKLEKYKAVVQVCSKEELKQKKEQLEALKSIYEQNQEEQKHSWDFWTDKLWNDSYHRIEDILETIKRENYSIIVTKKEEVFTLMAFYRDYYVEFYRIINVEEKYLECFPTDDMSKEFLEAYISENDEEMHKIYSKYF